MRDEIKDNKLKTFLQQKMETEKFSYVLPTLKSLHSCGARVIHQPHAKPAVYLLANNKTAKFFGNIYCHSPWSCPYCSADVMAKKGTDIACAIDALQTQHHQSPFMITFTMPHTAYMSCDECFAILTKAWRHLNRMGRRRGHKYWSGGKRTKAVLKVKGIDVFGKFREQLAIDHHVKVYEFVWSRKNGWHPHIHMLFFVPNDKIHLLTPDWEEVINNRWWDCLIKATREVYKDKFDPVVIERHIQKLFDEKHKHPITGHLSAFISKDDNGKPRKFTSSYYLSGWSGDMELTNSYAKVGKSDRITPWQILEQAYNAEDQKTQDFLLKTFFDYALTTFKHRRVEFSSHSGIRQIIDQWKQTQKFRELVKKKFMDRAKEITPWKVVCWFTEKQWSTIFHSRLTTQILQLALKPNARQLIEQLLLNYDIKLKPNDADALFIETQIFNVA